jgi:hypothetical protein
MPDTSRSVGLNDGTFLRTGNCKFPKEFFHGSKLALGVGLALLQGLTKKSTHDDDRSPKAATPPLCTGYEEPRGCRN